MPLKEYKFCIEITGLSGKSKKKQPIVVNPSWIWIAGLSLHGQMQGRGDHPMGTRQ